MIHRYAAGLGPGWDTHDDAIITLLIDGRIRESVPGHDGKVPDAVRYEACRQPAH